MEKKRNLWVIPTDKPSPLFYIDENLFYLPEEKDRTNWNKDLVKCQNIYITNEVEIKKDDYVVAYGVVIKVMMSDNDRLFFVNGTKAKREDCKKIILTTDQDLIKDGVQAIEDEFLEWFVKNPSCEFVETKLVEFEVDMGLGESCIEYGNYYKIIIPKEEPKQETLEEAFRKFKLEFTILNDYNLHHLLQVARFGAKWQSERMYSDEDMKKMYKAGYQKGVTGSPIQNNIEIPSKEWFEQFKKK